MSRYRVSVDADACLGSGVCVGSAPAHFEFRGGRSVLAENGPAPDDDVIEAAESCPAEAIVVIDADTGRVVAPS